MTSQEIFVFDIHRFVSGFRLMYVLCKPVWHFLCHRFPLTVLVNSSLWDYSFTTFGRLFVLNCRWESNFTDSGCSIRVLSVESPYLQNFSGVMILKYLCVSDPNEVCIYYVDLWTIRWRVTLEDLCQKSWCYTRVSKRRDEERIVEGWWMRVRNRDSGFLPWDHGRSLYPS